MLPDDPSFWALMGACLGAMGVPEVNAFVVGTLRGWWHVIKSLARFQLPKKPVPAAKKPVLPYPYPGALERTEHEQLAARSVEEWGHAEHCPTCYPPEKRQHLPEREGYAIAYSYTLGGDRYEFYVPDYDTSDMTFGEVARRNKDHLMEAINKASQVPPVHIKGDERKL